MLIDLEPLLQGGKTKLELDAAFDFSNEELDGGYPFSSVLKEIMWDYINTIYPIIDKVSEELNKDSTGFKMQPDELERIITIITTFQQIRDKQNV